MADKGHNSGKAFTSAEFDDLVERVDEQKEKQRSSSGTTANIFKTTEKVHGIHFNKEAFKIVSKIEAIPDDEKRADTMRSLVNYIAMRGWEGKYADLADMMDAD